MDQKSGQLSKISGLFF